MLSIKTSEANRIGPSFARKTFDHFRDESNFDSHKHSPTVPLTGILPARQLYSRSIFVFSTYVCSCYDTTRFKGQVHAIHACKV